MSRNTLCILTAAHVLKHSSAAFEIQNRISLEGGLLVQEQTLTWPASTWLITAALSLGVCKIRYMQRHELICTMDMPRIKFIDRFQLAVQNNYVRFLLNLNYEQNADCQRQGTWVLFMRAPGSLGGRRCSWSAINATSGLITKVIPGSKYAGSCTCRTFAHIIISSAKYPEIVP